MDELGVLRVFDVGQALGQPAFEEHEVLVHVGQDPVVHQQLTNAGSGGPVRMLCQRLVCERKFAAGQGREEPRPCDWANQESSRFGSVVVRTPFSSGTSSGRVCPVPSSRVWVSLSARVQRSQRRPPSKQPSNPQRLQKKSRVMASQPRQIGTASSALRRPGRSLWVPQSGHRPQVWTAWSKQVRQIGSSQFAALAARRTQGMQSRICRRSNCSLVVEAGLITEGAGGALGCDRGRVDHGVVGGGLAAGGVLRLGRDQLGRGALEDVAERGQHCQRQTFRCASRQSVNLGHRQVDAALPQEENKFGGGEHAVGGHQCPQPPLVADLAFHQRSGCRTSSKAVSGHEGELIRATT